MKTSKYALLVLTIAFFCIGTAHPTTIKKQAILVFSLTKGYKHASITAGIDALKQMGKTNGFIVDTTENVDLFTTANLKKYKTLVFLSPTGSNLFDVSQKQAIKQFINRGGGFVGIHAATDCNFEWEWYGKMIGGFFESHPKVQVAALTVAMPNNEMVKGLPQLWQYTDEWYNFKSFNHSVKVLLKADETSYQGGNMQQDHPISWFHEFEGGKIFYTALGHTESCYTDSLFLNHLLAGLKWTMK